MTLRQKTDKLRARMKKLAAHPDRAFFYRYIPVASNGVNDRPNTLAEKIRQTFPFQVPLWYLWPWEASLNYAPREGQAIICHAGNASGMDYRQAAEKLNEIFASMALVPVLLAESADFSFFVRLGWQIEYLPTLDNRSAYARKKLRYLALRYRNAMAIPLEAGLENEAAIRGILACQQAENC